MLLLIGLERNSRGVRRCVLNHGQFIANECNFPIWQPMSLELHVYQLQLDYLRSTEYDITASLRACVRVRAGWKLTASPGMFH